MKLWHTTSIEETLRELNANATTGLSSEEAKSDWSTTGQTN